MVIEMMNNDHGEEGAARKSGFGWFEECKNMREVAPITTQKVNVTIIIIMLYGCSISCSKDKSACQALGRKSYVGVRYGQSSTATS